MYLIKPDRLSFSKLICNSPFGSYPDHTAKYEQYVWVKVRCQIESAQMMRSLPHLQTVTWCPAYKAWNRVSFSRGFHWGQRGIPRAPSMARTRGE